MHPTVLDISEHDNILKFTISGINVSYANAIRRVILSDIPTIVFRTSPYEKNDATFQINTSRLNNEILKQRLSSIPIHMKDLSLSLDDYTLEVDVINNTQNIIYVTTNDFKIKSSKTGKYLNDSSLQKIFPPDSISHQYIDLCRLRPKLSNNLRGEQLKFSCKFSYGIASESGSFNVVSTCTYANTPNLTEIEVAKEKKLAELHNKYTNDSDINYHIQDWINLDAKRIFIPDSFNFKIESIGVFLNIDIVIKAVNIIIKRLQQIQEIYTSNLDLITNSDAVIANSFDIHLENEDYTIGKIIEYTLYHLYYNEKKIFTFCGFRKPHPHIQSSIIRIAFSDPVEKNTVVECIETATTTAIQYFKEILPELGATHKDDLKANKTIIPDPTSLSAASPADLFADSFADSPVTSQSSTIQLSAT